jgi:hypothetical protein
LKSIGLSRFCRTLVVFGALGATLGLPTVASADLLATYNPASTSSNDLNELDHHQMYAWKISDSSLKDTTITGATLVFENMYNWDKDANTLFLDLLDTAYSAGTKVNGSYNSAKVNGWGDCSGSTQNCISYFTDDPDSSNDDVTLRDDFVEFGDPRDFTDDKGWLIPDNTSITEMTSKTFLGPGQTYGSGRPYDGRTDPQGWTHTYDNGFYTYTYTFQADELNALNAYISNGGDFALGLDPDCHLYNTGISLNLYNTPFSGGSTVPEPTSLLLLGTGLAYAGRRYRRKR